MSAEDKVYSFQILDKDPECLTFGCVAQSLTEAEWKLARAGYTESLLLEVRSLSGLELDETVDLEILANPFLGPEWLTLIDCLAPYITRGRVGEFWTLNVATSPYTWGYSRPGGEVRFLQAMNEGDGSLHLEIGTMDLIRAENFEALDFLAFSGWNAPDDHLPIHFRVLEPGWNPRHALYVALQAMVTVLGVTAYDIFMPEGFALDAMLASDKFDHGRWHGPFQLESTAFALTGVHELSEDEPTKDVKDAVFAKLFPNADNAD